MDSDLLSQLVHQTSADILNHTGGACFLKFFNVGHEVMVLLINKEDGTTADAIRQFVVEKRFLGYEDSGGARPAYKLMWGQEYSIFVAEVFLAFDTKIKALTLVARPLHVNLNIRAYSRIVKYSKSLVSVAQVRDTINIE